MGSDETIIDVVRQLQRTYRGVFPWQVQMWLPFGMSVGYTRKTMARLWMEGKLMRIGGAKSRRGYRAAVVVMPRLQILRGGGRIRMARVA